MTPKVDTDEHPTTLGWREWVTLPDLSIPHIKAKLDTGARSSSLHAFRVETATRNGVERVQFWVHPLQRNDTDVVACECDILDRRWISDSGGHRELRYVIETTIVVGERTLCAEITLTNRDTMMFRMLLGRTALAGNCLVDSAKSFLLGRPLGRKALHAPS
jgi:hypothetical protein